MNPGKHSSSLTHAKRIYFTYMNWEYILFINTKLALACVNINVLICMFFIDLILMHLTELLKISTVLTYFCNNSQLLRLGQDLLDNCLFHM